MDEHADRVNLITIGQAREMLGVSRTTMARLVKEGRFTLYLNPLDRRQKLVAIEEVHELAAPVPMPAGMQAAEATPDNRPHMPRVGAEANASAQSASGDPVPGQHLAVVAARGEPDEERAFNLLITLAEAEHAVSESAFVLTSHGEIMHGGLPGGRITADLNDVDQLLSDGYIRVLPGVRRRLASGAIGREFVLTNSVVESLRHLGGG